MHQRWTCQLLCKSALLPHPSTLKLVSLPLVSGASLCLEFGDALHLAPPPTDNEVMLYQKGGCNHERNCCIPCISYPVHFVLRLRLKGGGGVFARHYGIYYIGHFLRIQFPWCYQRVGRLYVEDGAMRNINYTILKGKAV